MIESPPPEILDALRRMGLLATSTDTCGERLTGGVSSDIWRIDLPAGPVCVKRALAKLRVAADWQAPVERNRYEARWMQRANAAVPGVAPPLLGQDEASGALAMEFLPPDGYPLWKNATARRRRRPAHSLRRSPPALVRIHAATAADPAIAADFPTDRDFLRHPAGALSGRDRRARIRTSRRRCMALVATTQANKRALVHGDVSPKNILCGPRRPGVPRRRMRLVGRSGVRPGVLPQSSAAEMPVDAARHRRLPRLLRCAGRGVSGAASRGNRRPRWRRAPRVCCPGLLLARVDGKSPVEYITDEARQGPGPPRRSRACWPTRPQRLGDVRQAWTKELDA